MIVRQKKVDETYPTCHLPVPCGGVHRAPSKISALPMISTFFCNEKRIVCLFLTHFYFFFVSIIIYALNFAKSILIKNALTYMYVLSFLFEPISDRFVLTAQKTVNFASC